jgi:hypothetical protein
MNNDALQELTEYHNNVYGQLISDFLIRELNSFQGSSNPCCEIELPKEKKSEKPNFNQTKK